MRLEPAQLGSGSAAFTGAVEAPGSAAAPASRSRARRPRGLPGPAPSATPRLGVRQTPRLEVVRVVVALLLLLSLADLATADTLRDQPAAAQGQSPPQITCLPGQSLSKDGTCKPCIEGKSYTNQHNMKECIQCSICPEDTYQNTPCTTIRDTSCLCKAGTFRGKDSPEFCQTCTGCTDKEIEASPCTPESDRKCVSHESNANVTEDSIAPEKSTIIYYIIAVPISLAVFCLIAWMLYKMKKILFKNTCAEAVPNKEESSQEKDSSCVNLLWQRNFNDDDPQVIRSQTQDTGNGLAQKFLKCINQNVSVNTRQCGLEEQRERDTQDTTENHMGSGNSIHQGEIDARLL